MPEIDLKVEHLVLDNDNPRITHAAGQQEAFQKVVRDQKMKLVRLAESIVEHGLSPIERLMVLEVSAKPKRYIALEGNRRVAALKLLVNPAAMTGLEMPEGVQRSMERLAGIFHKSKVEPIAGYEVGSREEGRYWIELRHNGEDDGRGIVGWKPIVAARFRKREPAIQALDLAIEHGGFSEGEAEAIRSKFSLTTLRRLVESEEIRAMLGLTVKDGQLSTTLPANEIIKPLKKMVRDIADKKVNSRSFNKTEQMVNYVRGFAKADSPDLTKKIAERALEGIQKSEFTKTSAKPARRKPDPSDRREVVPKGCPIHVADNRIAEIYKELRTLKLDDAQNAIAVLLRVFLELSVDHFLESNGGSVSFKAPNGQTKFKSLDKKLAEVVADLVSKGVPQAHFATIIRSLNVPTSPMNIDLFHRYIHDRFATPSTPELKAAWEHAQPLFEKIWP
ncbi:hypothetical protein [Mesorhizobium sp. L-8-3]|uniref:hypothetical protein n=1 Tax=Mesorhizobium sp. L-8-3 TaxID=2744522 RepID=UPI0019281E08|nr:hypothetical protein [Mesorhizobium sp. L-8-3]BCH23582.1 hypothetical protein MesoLjLb_33670 [Mesorhizobium sp. L-8-3]